MFAFRALFANSLAASLISKARGGRAKSGGPDGQGVGFSRYERTAVDSLSAFGCVQNSRSPSWTPPPCGFNSQSTTSAASATAPFSGVRPEPGYWLMPTTRAQAVTAKPASHEKGGHAFERVLFQVESGVGCGLAPKPRPIIDLGIDGAVRLGAEECNGVGQCRLLGRVRDPAGRLTRRKETRHAKEWSVYFRRAIRFLEQAADQIEQRRGINKTCVRSEHGVGTFELVLHRETTESRDERSRATQYVGEQRDAYGGRKKDEIELRLLLHRGGRAH